MEPEDFYKHIREKLDGAEEKPAYDARLWNKVQQKLPPSPPWWVRWWPIWLIIVMAALQLGTWQYFRLKFQQQESIMSGYRGELNTLDSLLGAATYSKLPQAGVIRDTIYIQQRSPYATFRTSPHSFSRITNNEYSGMPLMSSLSSYIPPIIRGGMPQFPANNDNPSRQGIRLAQFDSTSLPSSYLASPILVGEPIQSIAAAQAVSSSTANWYSIKPKKQEIWIPDTSSQLKKWVKGWQFEAGIYGAQAFGKWGDYALEPHLAGGIRLGWQPSARWRIRVGLRRHSAFVSLDEDRLEELPEASLQEFPQPIYLAGELPEELDITARGFSMPIQAHYLLYPNQKLRPFIGVGATGVWMPSATVSYQYEDPDEEEEYLNIDNALTLGGSTFRWPSLRLDAGAYYQVLPQLRLELNGYYGIPLQSLPVYDWQQQTYGLEIGLSWNW